MCNNYLEGRGGGRWEMGDICPQQGVRGGGGGGGGGGGHVGKWVKYAPKTKSCPPSR